MKNNYKIDYFSFTLYQNVRKKKCRQYLLNLVLASGLASGLASRLLSMSHQQLLITTTITHT